MSDKTDTRKHPQRLRRWREGELVSARKLNETRDAVERLTVAPTGAREVLRDEAAVLKGQQFRVVSVDGDFLRCRKLEGPYTAQAVEGIFYVAKPYLLRRTPFDGTAGRNGITFVYSSDVARTATDSDDDTESQVIVPSYVEGDIIYGASGILGGTGVYYTLDGESTAVIWQDMNADGRAWAVA